MSKRNARYRAATSTLETISRSVNTHGGALGRQAALVAVGSGLVLSMAAPAQAGATASDPQPGSSLGTLSSAAAVQNQSPAVHTVVAGDTLGQIGAMHGVPLDVLLSLNGLHMDSIIYPGDAITLSAGAAVTDPASASVPGISAESVIAPSQVSALAPASADTGQAPVSSVNGVILDAARAQMGAIQDCTVLGEVALRAAGIQGVGDESPESLMTYATPVSTPEPGDFIYYADGGMGFSHNAVYIGDGQAIHSGWNGNQTVVFSVNVGSGPSYYRVNA